MHSSWMQREELALQYQIDQAVPSYPKQTKKRVTMHSYSRITISQCKHFEQPHAISFAKIRTHP